MVDDATLLFETVQHLLLLKPTPETTSDTVADSTGGPSATAPPTDIEPSRPGYTRMILGLLTPIDGDGDVSGLHALVTPVTPD